MVVNELPQNHTYGFTGTCPCGGKIKSSTWQTLAGKKSRSTCPGCGRTEAVTLAMGQKELAL